MKLLPTSILFLCILCFSVYSVEVVIPVNSSSESNGSFLVSYSLSENESIYFFQNKSDNFSNWSYMSNYTFVGNESFNQSFFYDLNFSNVSGMFFSEFLVNNSFNSEVKHLLVFFNYTYISAPVLVNETFLLNIVDGNYEVAISESFLPFEGTLKYRLQSNASEVTTVCDEWLTCPAPVGVVNDVAEVIVNYRIPDGTGVGVHTRSIKFKSGNKTLSTTVKFEVLEAQIDIKGWAWSDECRQSDGSINYECWVDYNSYMLNITQEAYQIGYGKAKAKYDKNVTEKEYVIIGDLEEDTYKELSKCRSDKEVLSSSVKTCNSALNSTSSNLTSCLFSLYDNNSLLLSRYYHDNKLWELEAEQEKTSLVNGFWTVVFIVLGVCVVGVLYYLYLKNNNDVFGGYQK